MKSNITSILTDAIYSSFQSASRYFLGQKEADLKLPEPKFPPELERQIFEACALDYPEICTNLILISQRVYQWSVNVFMLLFCLTGFSSFRIDPILIATVYIDCPFPGGQTNKLESFLSKLNSGRNPAEYYARYVKNLAFFGCFRTSEINPILAICTGVENLAIRTHQDLLILTPVKFFADPQAGLALRRLCIDYEQCGWTKYSGSKKFPSCFRNLTHLHLLDEYKGWPFNYTGWENLTYLTHLAFASCDTETLQEVMDLLPAIQFVALGNLYRGDQYDYIDVIIHDTPELDPRVVRLSNLPPSDWEFGARGKGDFWNTVEDEVERRLFEGRAKFIPITI